MHEKDLALAWDRWCCGEPLHAIAQDLCVTASQMHQELQNYLDRCVEAKRVSAMSQVAAA